MRPGHVVAHLVLGYPFSKVQFSWCNRSCAGRVFRKGPRDVEHCDDDLLENVHNSIIVSYAGMPAERLFDPKARAFHGSADAECVKKTCDEWNVSRRKRELCRQKAQELVDSNKMAIGHLASKICERLEIVTDKLTISQKNITAMLNGIPLHEIHLDY